ncbi:ABC transporter substrate-binding protein [Martelella sp. HB161492]|uniref:ABC transporter substrate-binding protein n=1 Tax=Martelella sp. HB161492 TaxID=2720726 RepID=UPI001592847B
MKMISKAALAAGVALLISTSALPALAKTPDNMLIMALRIDDLITMDPAQSFEFSAGEISNNIYQFLVAFDPLDLKKGFQPSIADSWDISEDGKTITFKIKDGLKFASGNPLTAKDVEFSLRRAVTLDKTPSFILTQFGFTPDNVDETLVATDDTTFKMTTDKPYAVSFVLNCLTANIASILDSKEVMSHEVDGDMGNGWLRDHSAGSGPYELTSWKPNESVTLSYNKNYTGDKPAMERVIIRNVMESASQRLMLEKGDIDIARNLTPEDVAAVKDEDGLKVDSELRGRLMYWSANQKGEVLSNPKVVEAMKYLTDYQGMQDSFLQGQYTTHQTFLPATYLGAIDDAPYSLDVAKGKELLAEAGYPDGFPLTIIVRDAQERIDIAQSLQNTWGQAGIDVNILVGTGAQTLDKYRSRDFDVYVGAWGPDYADPNTNASTFAANPDNAQEAGNTGYLAWRNAWDIPEYTKLTEAATVENDTAKRAAMYEDEQRQFLKDSPFGIMFQQIEQAAMSDNVKDFSMGAAVNSAAFWPVTK